MRHFCLLARQFHRLPFLSSWLLLFYVCAQYKQILCVRVRVRCSLYRFCPNINDTIISKWSKVTNRNSQQTESNYIIRKKTSDFMCGLCVCLYADVYARALYHQPLTPSPPPSPSHKLNCTISLCELKYNVNNMHSIFRMVWYGSDLIGSDFVTMA